MFQAPEALVFDLGGVLIDWDPRHLYRRLFADADDMEAFLQEVCTPEWNSRQDAGRPIWQAVDELVSRFPQKEPLIRAFYDRWDEMVAGAIPGSVEILKRLKQMGHPLYALSNWSAETFPRVLPRFEFLGWFRRVVISGETGTRKPDPSIYRLFLESTGLRAEQCLFIDDTPVNLEAAQQLGFKTILFTSPARLAEQLEQAGVSLSSPAQAD